MVERMLEQNRLGRPPGWEQLGIRRAEWDDLPLHVKNVPTMHLDELPKLCRSAVLLERWRTVERWLTDDYSRVDIPP